MKRFFALFAALTLFCTGISAQTAACRTETGIAYRDAAGDGYVDSLCRLDICWPADRKGFPTVVWFHGGGLTGGRREIPKALCGKGFAVVGVDCVDNLLALLVLSGKLDTNCDVASLHLVVDGFSYVVQKTCALGRHHVNTKL